MKLMDPSLSLAVSMHSNKGIYALLLGSGISRSAGIPTGWEVTLDLIRRLAKVNGADPEPDPSQWYRNAYGREPDYSELLENVAFSPEERQQILQHFFEPTADEREQHLKVPTAAHKAIARLVAHGYIRMIITTNFDRLMETALRDEGVTATVISTADAVAGARPYVHEQCVVLKVHGDYKDTRIKNTTSELANYDPRIHAYLDRVLDDFGLIVCGWSGQWDEALRAAIERCTSHRFTTYWAHRGHMSDQARRLVELRRAVTIEVEDADRFFTAVEEKVQSLDDLVQDHPLSVPVAVATLKRYVAEPRHRIRLHDMVIETARRTHIAVMDQGRFPTRPPKLDWSDVIERAKQYEGLSLPLVSLVANGCRWGDREHVSVWIEALEVLTTPPTSNDGYVALLNLRLYPALLVLYGGGIAAIGAGRYDILGYLLSKPRIMQLRKSVRIAAQLIPYNVIDHDLWQRFYSQRYYTPSSVHLLEVLRPPLMGLFPNDSAIEAAFDQFEIIMALTHWWMHPEERDRDWFQPGSYAWKMRRGECDALSELESMIAAEGDRFALLMAGLFDGKKETLDDAIARLKAFVRELPYR